ncbi:MAG TPA: hypothetical protein VN446_04670 [Candidatus Acidoferrum sp.]|nr:hypothetical protein [Candidatus Acidoferrum sp.]
MAYREPSPANSEPDRPSSRQSSEKRTEEGIVFKHDKEGLSIYITIYNTNNNANEESEAGLKQEAETGGQITSEGGQSANQGGQIAEKCGQNANQDSGVTSTDCAGTAEEPPE